MSENSKSKTYFHSQNSKKLEREKNEKILRASGGQVERISKSICVKETRDN